MSICSKDLSKFQESCSADNENENDGSVPRIGGTEKHTEKREGTDMLDRSNVDCIGKNGPSFDRRDRCKNDKRKAGPSGDGGDCLKHHRSIADRPGCANGQKTKRAPRRSSPDKLAGLVDRDLLTKEELEEQKHGLLNLSVPLRLCRIG